MAARKDPGAAARQKLLQWIQDLLGLKESSWTPPQLDFLDSLLQGQEGTKTLAELAVTSARIRDSGLKPEELGALRDMHEAIEAFWNNPGAETYENLRTVGQSLETDT
ncbi:MAG: hypothetical protein L0170_09810 [Acidobacteria bacterium]|nr:hypothetical protein [Acidobacteriota bacterium]